MKVWRSKKWGLFVGLALLLALTACGGGQPASQASDQPGGAEGDTAVNEPRNFIVSHFLPGHHPMQTEVLTEIFEEMKKVNPGVTYEFYPANALGDAGSHYDMAVTGEADVALSVHGYTAGRFPSVTVVELPFLAESAEHGSRIIQKLYEEFPEIQENHSDTTPLYLFTAEPAQILSVSHRIEKPEDLKGLRVRTPSQMGSKILEALGATPVSMPMSDVYESLQRGVIDAAMVPLETLHNWSFDEVVKYVTIGNFSPTPFYVVMNTDKYNSLSDAEKEVLKNLGGMVGAEKSGRVFDADGQKGLEKAKERGIEIIELTGDALKPWQDALASLAEEWIAEMEKQGYPGRQMYERALELKEELR